MLHKLVILRCIHLQLVYKNVFRGQYMIRHIAYLSNSCKRERVSVLSCCPRCSPGDHFAMPNLSARFLFFSCNSPAHSMRRHSPPPTHSTLMSSMFFHSTSISYTCSTMDVPRCLSHLHLADIGSNSLENISNTFSITFHFQDVLLCW